MFTCHVNKTLFFNLTPKAILRCFFDARVYLKLYMVPETHKIVRRTGITC